MKLNLEAIGDPVQNRFDIALLFDVRDGNPNGDPDAGNAPRVDPETGHGLVSDVCLKRKIRNYIWLVKGGAQGQPQQGYDIYVKEGAILNKQHERAFVALGLDPKTKESQAVDKARAWMCQTFFDIRMFGAVMSTGINCGQVRGPVQFAFARSVAPIVSLEQAITRMAVTTERESQSQEGGNRTMGRKEIVPYALYVAHGFVNPFLAQQTGFNREDLLLLLDALANMFELDRSAARGEMATRKLLVFEHASPLGEARAHELFSLIQVKPKEPQMPARSFEDYEVHIAKERLPQGVKLHELI
ncbi:MAG: type I-C CRISPR-associated protein Cas7/Csd2 [Candidatus Hydrogenedentota bacterium]|jgi:CRISPR-associated protein Csd2|uniref:CRISPR-associated protein, Csd2/Csh2 family n=1 Tax=Sumerlaea chitinivorans TaxID=2250252 RepID=A0A2Z4Y9P3_SUMC1|nr:CRISPR-associated protein, Csd2/Csh2 family [Candidatus Sumerlaea chitinivorans]MCX7964784.1 type I-C CRISPR-associated protein Cas7/Csd2 [Candidatus Sumerlaea chitinivorans]RMH23930.1 MAG: type I-C CRISPR-associated protein Cas7/Csd2 [Candidatus Hydrogenedentota bacterium]